MGYSPGVGWVFPCRSGGPMTIAARKTWSSRALQSWGDGEKYQYPWYSHITQHFISIRSIHATHIPTYMHAYMGSPHAQAHAHTNSTHLSAPHICTQHRPRTAYTNMNYTPTTIAAYIPHAYPHACLHTAHTAYIYMHSIETAHVHICTICFNSDSPSIHKHTNTKSLC